MSIKAMSAVFAIGLDADLSSADRMMLLAMADHADEKNVCWPSYDHLAHKCGVTRKSAMKTVARLAAQGRIKKTARTLFGERPTSNAYELFLDPAIVPSTGPSKQVDSPVHGTGGVPSTGLSDSPVHGTTCINPHLEPSVEPPSPPAAAGEGGQEAKKPKRQRKPQAEKVGHARNPFADAFKAAFDRAHPQPYAWKPGDFKQLKDWQEAYPDVTPDQFVAGASAHWGRGKFVPGSSLTIRGLCADWAQLSAYTPKDKAGPDEPDEYGWVTHYPTKEEQEAILQLVWLDHPELRPPPPAEVAG